MKNSVHELDLFVSMTILSTFKVKWSLCSFIFECMEVLTLLLHIPLWFARGLIGLDGRFRMMKLYECRG